MYFAVHIHPYCYLAGGVVECVIVQGASLPVLDLDEAGVFGGAAILQRLAGRGAALGWRLEKAHRHLTVNPSSTTLLCM